MAVYFDEAWLKSYYERTGNNKQEEPKKEKKRKYGNTRVTVDGETFDSKHEYAVYQELVLRAKAGDIMAIAKQVAFYLPGGVKYLADFVIFLSDGTFEIIDAKSEATRKDKVYRLKKRLMKECLKLEIIEQ